MTLTLGPGPLGTQPGGDANYTIDGPAHRIWFQAHPRRIRAELAGEVVLDTVGGHLLHESNLLPRLYVPFADLDADRLTATDHTTHCPFKGDAAYWTLTAGERVRENAVWAYPDPLPAAPWLADFASVYHWAADVWYEEDEPVLGHFRDPYHRVDARRSARRADVTARGETVASSERTVLVFETGLPPRPYVPRDDVAAELVRSETTSVCPYKGAATYWSVKLGDRTLEDAAWSYEEPLPEAQAARGHVAFMHDELAVSVAAP